MAYEGLYHIMGHEAADRLKNVYMSLYSKFGEDQADAMMIRTVKRSLADQVDDPEIEKAALSLTDEIKTLSRV